MGDLEQRTMSKVSWRLVPFLMLCYFIAYLDRVNVGFAGGSMSKDLGLTADQFGNAAGIFFIAYFFFEVPSNLALHNFGARRWIARIMFTWGLVSGAQAFVTGVWSFNIVRLLLGVAEAGFFPGIIFFLTLWFPSSYRARIVGLFMFAIPVSTVIGAPISGFVLNLEGVAGLHGWQWVYLIEAAPALLMTFAVLFYLTDRPGDAHWLAPDERKWLQDRLDGERVNRESFFKLTWPQSVINTRVVALGVRLHGAQHSSIRPQLLPAADRQGFRRQQHSGGFHHRGPLSRRRRRDGPVGAPFRPHRRAQVARRRLFRDDGDRPRPRLAHRQCGRQDGGDLRRHLRVLRHPPGVLDPADRLPQRRGRGGGNRRHQLDRQSWRLLRPESVRLSQGCDAQRFRRASSSSPAAPSSASFWC